MLARIANRSLRDLVDQAATRRGVALRWTDPAGTREVWWETYVKLVQRAALDLRLSDPWAGTPWHKTVPARLERVPV